MNTAKKSSLREILLKYESELLTEWAQAQHNSFNSQRHLLSDADLPRQAQQFLTVFCRAVQQGNLHDVTTPAWAEVWEVLAHLSAVRATQGFSPVETAAFIFTLKRCLLSRLYQEDAATGTSVREEIEAASQLLDTLGLYTVEVSQEKREEVITQQQHELLELSTPVMKLWAGIVALPLIGTLDSGRAQVVMETLLQEIVAQSASIAIIDITGVPTVDTMVAQHLMQTVAAARLMGAECIISGIRPQIAQTIVHLGIDLSMILTRATLADAFAIALQRRQLTIISLPDPRANWSQGGSASG